MGVSVFSLHRSRLNPSEWDAFIADSPQHIIYAYSWHLDTVCSDWYALVVSENDQWLAVMPVPVRKKWGIYVVQQPFFCQLLGIFTRSGFDIQQAEQLLLSQLTISFRYISVYTGRLSADSPVPQGMTKQPAVNHILPLYLPYSALYEGYSRDRQLNLKRAKVFQWETQHSTDIDPIIQLFKENHEAQIKGSVSESAYELLRNIFRLLQQKSAVRLVYALKNGVIEAGALFVVSDKRIIYLFNAASARGRKGNARTLLIDQLVQEYAETDFVFDFESPALPSIASFYRSFGTVEEHYSILKYNRLPFPLKQIQQWRLQQLREKG